MRLLYAIPIVPYPIRDGAGARIYNLVRGLAARHDLHLVIVAWEGIRGDAIAHLRQFCARVDVFPLAKPNPPRFSLGWWHRRGQLFRTPVGAYHSQEAQRYLDALVSGGGFEVILLETSKMAQYGMAWKSRNVLVLRQNDEVGMARRVLAVQPWGIQRVLWLSLLGWAERFERRLARAIPRIVAVSEVDAEAFRRFSPDVEVAVVPNAVDTTRFQPPTVEPGGHAALLFTGSMGYFPNRDAVDFFCAEIWPAVRARHPHVRFRVVGSDADRHLIHLASTPGVEILGTVEDMRPVLAGGAVVVVPLRVGSGTRLKILEAMAMGRAIVSTSVGCEGLAVRSGEHLLVADDPRTFAEAVNNLLADPARRRALGRNARVLVEARYGWDQSVAALEALLERRPWSAISNQLRPRV